MKAQISIPVGGHVPHDASFAGFVRRVVGADVGGVVWADHLHAVKHVEWLKLNYSGPDRRRVLGLWRQIYVKIFSLIASRIGMTERQKVIINAIRRAGIGTVDRRSVVKSGGRPKGRLNDKTLARGVTPVQVLPRRPRGRPKGRLNNKTIEALKLKGVVA